MLFMRSRGKGQKKVYYDTGWVNCQNASDDGSDWTNPSKATVSNDDWAECGLLAAATSSRIRMTNPDMSSIPANAVIVGVEYRYERHVGSTGGGYRDAEEKLIVGGSAGGSDKSSGTNWPTTDGTLAKGGSTDLHGYSNITVAQVQGGTNFGFGVKATTTSARTGYIDVGQMKVYYYVWE